MQPAAMRNVTVGLVSTLSPEFGAAPGREDKRDALQLLAQARAVLQELGASVVDPGEPTSTRTEASRHADLLRRSNIHVLLVYLGHWTHAHVVLALTASLRVPVVIWSDLRPGATNLTGVGVVRGTLESAGVRSWLVMGGFDDPDARRSLAAACQAASAVYRLRGQLFGFMGHRSMGMGTCTFDPSDWYRRFGLDVDDWDMLETVEKARALGDDDPRVSLYKDWITKTFGSSLVTDETIIASIKLYLISKEVVQTRGYDFVAVKCLPYMPSIYTTFCFAVALLNDDSDADGPKPRTVCACEADANGALTMQILNLLSDSAVDFADLFQIDRVTREAVIANCGSQATQLAKSRKHVRWLPNEMVQFDWRIHGMCPAYVCKPGRVTVARMSRVENDYVMLIAMGDALEREMPKDEFAPFCARMYLRFDCSVDELLQNLKSNHVNVVYGDYQQELLRVCELTGTRAIVLPPA